MTYFEFRERIESAVPWWSPFVFVLAAWCILVIVWWKRGK